MANKIYKCSVCGNIVELLHVGGGELVCCDKSMILQKELEEEEGRTEKHRPIVDVKDGEVVVTVGSTLHPMDEDHYIEWIELETPFAILKKFLRPGDDPIAKFPVSVSKDSVSARAYCNLHGLWKS